MSDYTDPRQQYAHAAIHKSFLGSDYNPGVSGQPLRPAQLDGYLWLKTEGVDAATATAQSCGAIGKKTHILEFFNAKALTSGTAAIKITDVAGNVHDVVAALDLTAVGITASADMAEIANDALIAITISTGTATEQPEIGMKAVPARNEWK